MEIGIFIPIGSQFDNEIPPPHNARIRFSGRSLRLCSGSRWGMDASSDVLRRNARCSACGRRRATLQHPSWRDRWVRLNTVGATLTMPANEGFRRVYQAPRYCLPTSAASSSSIRVMTGT